MAVQWTFREPLSRDDLEQRLKDRFPDLGTHVEHEELTLFVPPERIREVLAHCRDDDELDFDLLADLSGVHWPGGEHVTEAQISTTGWPPHRLVRDRGTIEVTYHLLSTHRTHRLRIVVAVHDTDPVVPSVVELHPTANFHEREVFDFFGVLFQDHPNLIRILMPDEWIGHPLRKDYPLGGVDTDYHGAYIPPPDERLWSREVPHAGGEKAGK
ncbi:MAG: NADH-quinone oxidoreductase subunit C [Actinomycetota bacterium]|nr:NADH-quinone oxidoreductase subunit C [Actinomycetota bacterium]